MNSSSPRMTWHRRTCQRMAEPYAGTEFSQADVVRGCRIGADPEPGGGPPHQRRVARRVSRREQQQPPGAAAEAR